jgi:hypothetical protein
LNLTLSCERCQRLLPADAPGELCPACLLALGLAETPEGTREATPASATDATLTASARAVPEADSTVTAGSEAKPEADWPQIPGHRIVGELGEGGGGRVFLAEQLQAGRRQVALKVLHGTGRSDRERLRREAESLGRLAHPNAVTIFEVGETPLGPYFTMEHMAGGSLSRRIKQQPLTPLEAARVVEAVARAVAAGHAQRILHRDLKPSNVLLAADGTPKVSDFGLAKIEQADDESSLERVTPTGAMLGTPGYMAPEQAAGKVRELDEQTDVYGLGALLYHCLTGRAPFPGQTRFEILQNVLGSEVTPPRRLNPSVPKDLEAVCLKCLRKQKPGRYSTADEVADELMRVLAGESTRVRPAGPIARGLRRARRNKTIIAWASVGLLLLAAVGVAIALALRRHEDPPSTPQARESAVERMNHQLRTGPVTVVPAEGLPDWESWPIGAARLTTSPANDGSCAFQTIGTSVLDLAAPDLDSYRVSVEVRQLRRQRVDEKGETPERDLVALFVGRQELRADDGARVQSLVIAGYSESLSPQLAKLNGGRGRARAEVFRFVQDRDAVLARQAKSIAPPANFKATGPEPGEWRGIRADVTPTGVRFWWRPSAAAPYQEWAFVERPAIEQSFRDATKGLPAAQRAKFGDIPYHWEPQSPLGIYAEKGWVAVRNLVLEPIPEPDSAK